MVPNNFIPKPWYQRSTNITPRASFAVESFLESCERDLIDPKLRRRIKDNLSPAERKALKSICLEFPRFSIRVRKEDKGSRFALVKAHEDDSAIKKVLDNKNNYEKLEYDPTNEAIQKVTL